MTRHTLRDRLWPETIVEFDKGLNYCVREVRAALGDHASTPVFIETLPRRGYRFIAPVHRVSPQAPDRLQVDIVGPTQRKWRSPQKWRTPILAAGIVLLAFVTLIPQLTRRTDSLDPHARELGAMGGYFLTRATGPDLERSVTYFRQALVVDGDYARAYAGLGNAYLRLGRTTEGKAALRRSLELDPAMWASHINLALHALNVEYDRAEAEPHFTRAVQLAPDQVVVRHTYAWFLAARGELDAATEQMREALALDPVSPRVNGDVGRLFYLAGQHEEAVAHCRRAAELLPDSFRPRDCTVHALAERGAYQEARAEAVSLMSELGANATTLTTTGESSAAVVLDAYWTWSAGWITRLATEGKDSHVHAAAAWARAHEPDSAFAALERAYAVRCPVLLQISSDPALRLLEADQRYARLLHRTGGATPH